jgi:hypothetical protein
MNKINTSAPSTPFARTCHQMGVCLYPQASCVGQCQQALAMQRLAPGVVDGPYHPKRSRSDRLSRTLMLLACLLAVVVVLVQIAAVA